jgi:ABC-2 type transport system ATP-binding protein
MAQWSNDRTAYELTYHGLIRGLRGGEVARRAEELLTVLELTDAERTLVIDYSTGMRKIGLATALLHAPKLLVLDEPFEAVDPVSAATIRTILQRFVASGGSVVFSSHVMALVEMLCDHVALITRGVVAASGTVEAVRGDRGLEDVFVELAGARTGGPAATRSCVWSTSRCSRCVPGDWPRACWGPRSPGSRR